MSSESHKFFLTTPIYYVNARPHIGHAYTTIVADVLARRHRLLGDDTFFLTGTDEHGQKIERSAAAAGIPPQEFADKVSKSFADLWERMGIIPNKFVRTTDEAHKRGVQKLFADLHARGQIYLSSYTGQYSIGEEMFVDGPPGTIGPDGKPTETVTEENFFFRLSDYQLPLLDLIESDTLKITPESRKNEVLSFLRGNFIPELAPHMQVANQHIRDLNLEDESASVRIDEAISYLKTVNGGAIGNARLTKARNFYLHGALKDLSISRSSFTWGIPVPEPAASEAKEKHVIYVWLDALANYMTALGYGSADDSLWQKFWPADLQLVGKEIIRFHCVYWPAFLMAAGLPLPKAVTAHGWLLFDDSKMSKSKGNIVRTETILDAFGEDVYAKQFPESTKSERDLFASDILRYFLLREIPFGQDGNFSLEAMVTRYNADLANGYGNLVSRTLSMISKYYPESCIPLTAKVHPQEAEPEYGMASFAKRRFLAFDAVGRFQRYFGEYFFSSTLESLWLFISSVDRFISAEAPWKLGEGNEDQQRRADVLYIAAESIRIITALLYPILPYAAASVWSQLGLGDIGQAASNGELKDLQWGGLKPGTKLGPLSPIFPRADKGILTLMNEMESANTPKPAAEPEPVDTTHPAAAPRTSTLAEPNPGAQVAASAAPTTERIGTPSHTEAASGIFSGAVESPQITIDDFAKVELRVAKILVAERIPKADKLLRLEVDLGYEKRQILSGIAEHYTPEELIGRRIVVITNLAPRKMRGLESHGMLLAASDGDHGKPILASFADTDAIPLGSRLK